MLDRFNDVLFTRLISFLKKDSEAATAAEYALLVALIAVVVGVGIAAFGTSIKTFFTGLYARLGLPA